RVSREPMVATVVTPIRRSPLLWLRDNRDDHREQERAEAREWRKQSAKSSKWPDITHGSSFISAVGPHPHASHPIALENARRGPRGCRRLRSGSLYSGLMPNLLHSSLQNSKRALNKLRRGSTTLNA